MMASHQLTPQFIQIYRGICDHDPTVCPIIAAVADHTGTMPNADLWPTKSAFIECMLSKDAVRYLNKIDPKWILNACHTL